MDLCILDSRRREHRNGILVQSRSRISLLTISNLSAARFEALHESIPIGAPMDPHPRWVKRPRAERAIGIHALRSESTHHFENNSSNKSQGRLHLPAKQLNVATDSDGTVGAKRHRRGQRSCARLAKETSGIYQLAEAAAALDLGAGWSDRIASSTKGTEPVAGHHPNAGVSPTVLLLRRPTSSKCVVNSNYSSASYSPSQSRPLENTGTAWDAGTGAKAGRATSATYRARVQPEMKAMHRCRLCDKAFTHMGLLKGHMASVHSVSRAEREVSPGLALEPTLVAQVSWAASSNRHPCPHCPMTFATQSRARAHEKRVHASNSPPDFKSSTCDDGLGSAR